MRVETYRQFGGQIPELTALRHVITHHRVLCRQTSAPPTEPMLFGISGGIGVSYAVAEREDLSPELRIGFGPRGRARPGDVLQTLCVRMGLPASFRHTLSPEVAERSLSRSLEQGDPVIVFLHPGHLSHLGATLPSQARPLHVAVVFALSDEGASLADISPHAIQLTRAQLAEARQAEPSVRQLAVVVSAPASPVDLPKAMEAGIRSCWERMIDPPLPKTSSGIPGLRRLVSALSEPGEAEAWARRFPPGQPLLDALLALYAAIQLGGSGGGAGRHLFATFLREAGLVLQGPDLDEVAARYDNLAAGWEALASTILPDSVPGLHELRTLACTQELLIRSAAADAPAQLERTAARLAVLKNELSDDFPLGGAARQALLAELGERMRALVLDEESAIRAIKAAAR